MFQSLGNLVVGESQIAGHSGTGSGIVFRGAVDERQFAFPRLVGHGLARQFPDVLCNHRVVGGIEHHLGIVEELQFLLAFLVHRSEILLMGRSHVGKHADGGLDDVAQCSHLARHTDARLEESHLRLFVQQPHGERHADLRIVGARRTRHHLFPRQYLEEPFLHDGLAVAARDAHRGYAVFVTMALGQSLQGLDDVGHAQEVAVGITHGIVWRHGLHHEIAHAATVEFADVAVSVVSFRLQCKKQSFLGEAQTTAVGKQETDVTSCVPIAMRPNERSDLFNRIVHLPSFSCKVITKK